MCRPSPAPSRVDPVPLPVVRAPRAAAAAAVGLSCAFRARFLGALFLSCGGARAAGPGGREYSRGPTSDTSASRHEGGARTSAADAVWRRPNLALTVAQPAVRTGCVRPAPSGFTHAARARHARPAPVPYRAARPGRWRCDSDCRLADSHSVSEIRLLPKTRNLNIYVILWRRTLSDISLLVFNSHAL